MCKLCSVHALKSNLNYAQTQHIKVANLCKGPVNSSVLKTGRKDSVLLENGALQLGMSSQYNIWHIKLDCLALLRHVSPTNHQALTVYTTARPHIYIYKLWCLALSRASISTEDTTNENHIRILPKPHYQTGRAESKVCTCTCPSFVHHNLTNSSSLVQHFQVS